jgi:hypothetical protein
MPITFVIQITIAIGLIIVNDAAPGLVATEWVGAPKIGLKAG